MTATVKVKAIDLSGWQSMMRQLTEALWGSGQNGDLHQLVRVEAGQTAWDMMNALGPRSREGSLKDIENNLRSTLSVNPKFENLKGDQTRSTKYANWTWLTSSDLHLLGINQEDNRRDASADEALKIHFATKRKGGRGKAYIELGRHGVQHVMKLNRTRVKSGVFNDVKRYLGASVGQLKASFAATALKLIPGKRVPGWVRSQFGNVEANGKMIFNDAALNRRENPTMEFGSRAKGVETNPVVREAIERALTNRVAKLKKKVEQLKAGYTYDWNNGRVFKRRVQAES